MKLGIDFGTCFSFTAVCIGNEIVPLVGNDERIYDENNGIPTVFYNDASNKEIMGKRAAALTAQFPNNGIAHIKKEMRDKRPTDDTTYTLGGVKYTAKAIIVRFIKFLISNSANALKNAYPGENANLENLVIAVPAMSSSDYYRGFIHECAIEASGLNKNKVHLIDEPVAAALSYYTTRSTEINDGNRILTFDLGGGTFDSAIVVYDSTKSHKFEVLAQSGNTSTGGTNWDDRLRAFVLSENSTLTLPHNERYKFVEEIIRSKIRLSSEEKINFSYLTEDGDVFKRRNLTRKEFVGLTIDELNKTIQVTKDLIATSRKGQWLTSIFKRKSDGYTDIGIDAIVLSGGASQMPMIRERLEIEFPGTAIRSERPDRAIAFGAAIYASNLDSLMTVSPHTYGVNCNNRELNKSMINNILFRNTPIKKHSGGRYISAESNYCPLEPDQKSMTFKVYESDASVGTKWLDFENRKYLIEVSFSIEPVEGIITTERSYAAEIRIVQGGMLELHVYDNDQNRKEVGFKTHRL